MESSGRSQLVRGGCVPQISSSKAMASMGIESDELVAATSGRVGHRQPSNRPSQQRTKLLELDTQAPLGPLAARVVCMPSTVVPMAAAVIGLWLLVCWNPSYFVFGRPGKAHRKRTARSVATQTE